MGDTSQPSLKRSRARNVQPWPYKAGQVADDIMAALSAISGDADTISRQAEAVDRLTDTCLQQIANGNVLLAQRILLDLRKIAIAQSSACVSIRSRAGMSRAALAAARVGEYGEG
jgi:hypothetical protein